MRLFFQYLGKFFGFIFKNLGLYFKFLPMGFTGIFLISNFISNYFSNSFAFAFSELSKTLFASELIINQKVHLAIVNAVDYGLFDLIEIFVSLYVLWIMIKLIAKVLIKFSGSQAEWGAYIVALVIVGIIEISAVKIIDGHFGFIPIWNGLIFLIMNIKPVIINTFIKGTTTIIEEVIVQNTTNTTIVENVIEEVIVQNTTNTTIVENISQTMV